MARAAGLDRIRDLLGAEAVVEHAPVDVDGRPVEVTVRPGDGEAVAQTLAALAKSGLGAFVRGGGGRFGVGNRPSGGDVILSTERLVGIDVFEPAEGVCHARAGTTIADIRARVNPEGWDVPLDPPGERSTLGGTLAAAAVGPRCHGYGPPRDALLGLEVAFVRAQRRRRSSARESASRGGPGRPRLACATAASCGPGRRFQAPLAVAGSTALVHCYHHRGLRARVVADVHHGLHLYHLKAVNPSISIE